jgi:hypothetical protein
MMQTRGVFGLLKPDVDVHTMGICTIANLLKDCGYTVYIAGAEVNSALEDIRKVNNWSLVKKWITDNAITRIGFSYRLDPKEGCDYFMSFLSHLKEDNMLVEDGGQIEELSFAGLPETCSLIDAKSEGRVVLFPGNETPVESLRRYGVPEDLIPVSVVNDSQYDTMIADFARKYIESGRHMLQMPLDHYGYSECGTDKDSFVARLDYARGKGSLPIIRTHSGPYNPDRMEALKEYNSWCRDLASSRLLDVLSIGSSQLTQSRFGEDWDGMANGGGVPVNSEIEYRVIKENAHPMLVRTYSGTRDVPGLAEIHERSLNISWHALSFWWFNELDGRGKNSLLDNLKEHFETVRYIAATGKPVEPNVPHHFAFRGADDVSYIVSGYLAAKACKLLGAKHLILQNMLNTPKYTWGIQDLAKGRVMLKLVRELEDSTFTTSLQSRAGLDYFAPDLEEAKVQLAAVTCLMDDIEPGNNNSPEIIHVVNYSEAVRLATPPVIKESIQITLNALHEYRLARTLGKVPDMKYDKDVQYRYEALMYEARAAIRLLEDNIPDLYTPEGFAKVFEEGFLAVPYLMDQQHKYSKATMWKTAIKNGGISVVDEDGKIISTEDRYHYIIDRMER